MAEKVTALQKGPVLWRQHLENGCLETWLFEFFSMSTLELGNRILLTCKNFHRF